MDMSYSSPLFLITILSCFFDAQHGAFAVCRAGKGSSPGQVTTCESSHCESVCLVCGDHLLKGVKWMMGDAVLAQGNFTLGVISGSKVNECHGNSSSLRLDSCHEQINNAIRCELDGKVLANFRLESSAKETLTIVGDTLQYTDQNITLERGLNVSLLCVIQHALPPVTLEWIVDERLNYTERFTSNETTNFSIPILINTSTVQNSITCASYGDKTNMTQRLVILNRTTAETAHRQIGMAIAFVLAAIFTVIIFFMKLYNNCKEKGGTNSIDMEENVCYVGLDNLPTGMIRTKTEPMTSLESEETKDKKTLLRKQIQSGQPFEYWSACISTKDSHSYPCVAKKLSDQATIRDYESMKNLVQSLSLLDMGSGFVQILHSSIQTLPFAIYYEELNFGTLCDHVVSRFPTELLLNTNRKLQPTNHAPVLKYLLKFAEDIIKAMQYLAHKKFSHPALSLRKVLMTENGSCKLYSIYPNELCVERIQQLLKKENPPLAWMATEVFLLEKYFPESDIWNISVFMWELLSIGEYPCAGLLQMDIKKKILEGFLLPRPKVCPKNLFRVLMSCWRKDHNMRPSLADILQTIRDLRVRLDTASKNYEENSYSEIEDNTR